MALYAGPAAERLLRRRPDAARAHRDELLAEDIAVALWARHVRWHDRDVVQQLRSPVWRQIANRLAALALQADQRVHRPESRQAIVAVAEALLAPGVVPASTVKEIVRQAAGAAGQHDRRRDT